jgi:hypothetical protein
MWTMPDAVQFFCDYLEPELGVPVGVEAAGTAPFVRINRTGGPKQTPVSDRPQITFEIFHRLGSGSWALAEQTREAVYALAGTTVSGINVKDVQEAGGPQSEPDPTFPALHRHTFTLLVHMRGAP